MSSFRVKGLIHPAIWQFISLQERCQVHDMLWLIILYYYQPSPRTSHHRIFNTKEVWIHQENLSPFFPPVWYFHFTKVSLSTYFQLLWRHYKFWKYFLTHNEAHLQISVISLLILYFISHKECGIFKQTLIYFHAPTNNNYIDSNVEF